MVRLTRTSRFMVVVCFFILMGTASANVIDNTKNVFVYIDAGTVAHDEYFTSMFYEYNLSYVCGDTLTSESLSGVDLLLVAGARMSNESAIIINDYMLEGGCVWFFGDPRLNSTGTLMGTRINIFPATANSEYSISQWSKLNIVSDSITTGLPPTCSKTGSLARSTYTRKHAADTGSVGGYTYKALCYSYWDCRLMMKFENTTTGSRVLYSNPDCFISGGSSNYFNSSIATRLFYQSKSWILGLDTNTYGVQVTYPKGDKIYTSTLDDILLSDSEISTTNDYVLMKKCLPYNIPDTMFVCWDGQYATKNAISYFESMFDIHTIHPHDGGWGVSATPVEKYSSKLHTGHLSIVDEKTQSSDYGIHVYRYGGTTGSTNASIAMADAEMWISANRGPGTNMGAIGHTITNNLWFPKQKIYNNIEICTIEIETPTPYDIDDTPSGLYSHQVGQFTYFSKVNFPSNYVLGAHKQGVMQDKNYRSNTSHWLNYICDDTTYTVFDTLSNIAYYNHALEKATVVATDIDDGIQVNIIAVEPIVNFTIKINNISNGLHIQYDNTDIGIDHVVYEDNVYYVFHDISVGAHAFVIKDISMTDEYGVYIGKNGKESKPIKNSVYSCTNNAKDENTVSIDTNRVFIGAKNSISSTQNYVSIPRRSSVDQIDLAISPASGSVNVSVSTWATNQKIWTESSDVDQAVTHTIGGLPTNRYIKIYRDGVLYDRATTNSAGTLTWVYDGGFSTHTFEIISSDAATVTISNPGVVEIDSNAITSSSTATTLGGLYDSVIGAVISGYSLATILILIIGAALVLRYMGWM